MKTYKVHWIYILIIALGLSFASYTLTRELIDPAYRVPRPRYLPRPVIWSLIVYCWYKFLTAAYRVETDGKSSMKTTSLTGSRIISEAKKIKQSMMFIQVISTQGTVSISTLIDGISNVKELLRSFIRAGSDSIE